MRIISEFHDYYDCIQGAGQDQSLIFLRRPKEVQLGKGVKWPFPLLVNHYFYSWWHGPTRMLASQTMIGFCGKVYPVIGLQKDVNEWDETFCFGVDEVDAFVKVHYKDRQYKVYRSADKRQQRRYWSSDLSHAVFKKFFEDCLSIGDSCQKFFEHGPIFVIRPKSQFDRYPTIKYNVRLEDWKFYRRIDSYTAFQELQMYLGAQAVPQEVIPEVSDKDMVTAKGFDKFSFRKPPSKKK